MDWGRKSPTHGFWTPPGPQPAPVPQAQPQHAPPPQPPPQQQQQPATSWYHPPSAPAQSASTAAATAAPTQHQQAGQPYYPPTQYPSTSTAPVHPETAAPPAIWQLPPASQVDAPSAVPPQTPAYPTAYQYGAAAQPTGHYGTPYHQPSPVQAPAPHYGVPYQAPAVAPAPVAANVPGGQAPYQYTAPTQTYPHYYQQPAPYAQPPQQPPPPPIQAYNPAAHHGPSYQLGVPVSPGHSSAQATAAPPTAMSTGRPTSLYDPFAATQTAPISGPPSSPQATKPRLSKFGASLTGLVQNKIQGYLSQVSTAQAGSGSSGPGVSPVQSGTYAGAYSPSSMPQTAPYGGPTGTQYNQPAVVPPVLPSATSNPQLFAAAQLAPITPSAPWAGPEASTAAGVLPISTTDPYPVPVPSSAPPIDPVPDSSHHQSWSPPLVQQPVTESTSNTARIPQSTSTIPPQQASISATQSIGKRESKLQPFAKLASQMQQMLLSEGSAATTQPSTGGSAGAAPSASTSIPTAHTSGAKLSSAFAAASNLASNVATTLKSGAIPYDSSSDWDDFPQLVTPMRASGPRDPISRCCIRDSDPDYDATWYRLPSAPSFPICTWCHANYIAPSTVLARAFETFSTKGVRCLWHEPRVTKQLWPEARRTGDLAPLVSYMNRRAELPRCKGQGNVLARDKFSWFGPADKSIPDFFVCEACYEGIVLGTGFARRFSHLDRIQGQNDQWSCNMAVPYTKRAILKMSIGAPYANNLEAGWAEFVRTVTHRTSLSKCNHTPVTAKEITWYRPRGTTAEIYICEGCFLDNLALSRYAGEFTTVDVMKSIQTKFAMHICDLQLSMSQLIWACDMRRLPSERLKSGMEAIWANPRCFTANGIKGGRWHNFHTEVGNFGVCEGCFAGIFVSDGMEKFFAPKPKQTSAQTTLYCVWNPSAQHYKAYLDRYVEAMTWGSFSIYENYARKWAGIRTCERSALVGERAWYGWNDCLICQECHETYVSGTALARSLPLQAEFISEVRACTMYSPRMRGLYTDACTSGSVDEMLAYSRKRNQVHAQTVPKIQMLRDKINAEMNMANAQMQMSANWHGIDGMAAAIGEVQTAYWDSSAGAYRSSDRMAADGAWNRAMAGYDRANDPAIWREIEKLEAQWKEVE